jgi:hypothetical protein
MLRRSIKSRVAQRVAQFEIQLMDARLRIPALRYSPQRNDTHWFEPS